MHFQEILKSAFSWLKYKNSTKSGRLDIAVYTVSGGLFTSVVAIYNYVSYKEEDVSNEKEN